MELRILKLGACGELEILDLGACKELRIISREIKWDLLTPTGLHFGSSKLSNFSFLGLHETGKMCYNYIKKGERKKIEYLSND